MGAAVQRSYTLEEVETGLHELARWHGNYRQAARTLAEEQGFEIPPDTLYSWKSIHAERYQEISEQAVPAIRSKLADTYEVIGRRSGDLAMKAMDRLAENLNEVAPRDLAGAIRNLATTGAIGVDKASLLRGMPTEIRQTDSAEDILKRLAQKHPGMFVEQKADAEIPDAEVVEESPRRGAKRQLSPARSSANAPTKD